MRRKETSLYVNTIQHNILQVFQRRKDGSQDFNQPRDAYRDGFGDLCGEFWWGLKWINILTTDNYWTLRVDLTDFDGATKWAEYDEFDLVGSEDDDYQLDLGKVKVSGSAGT